MWKKEYIIPIFLLVFLLSIMIFVASETYLLTTFNNSLSTENISFFSDANHTRYLEISKYANVSTAYMNFTGFLGKGNIVDFVNYSFENNDLQGWVNYSSYVVINSSVCSYGLGCVNVSSSGSGTIFLNKTLDLKNVSKMCYTINVTYEEVGDFKFKAYIDSTLLGQNSFGRPSLEFIIGVLILVIIILQIVLSN